jgi:hypothetical protein
LMEYIITNGIGDWSSHWIYHSAMLSKLPSYISHL